MNAIKAILGWFLRKSIVFVLIVSAVAFHQLMWPMISDGTARTAATEEWKSPAEIKTDLMRLKRQAIADLETSQGQFLAMSGRELAAALQEKHNDLAKTDSELKQQQGWLASVRPTAIIAREKLKLRRGTLSAEIALLETAKDREARRAALNQISFPRQSVVDAARLGCERANKAVRTFNSSGYARRAVGNLMENRASKLTQTAKAECLSYKSKRTARETGLAAGKVAQAELEAAEVALAQVQNDVAAKLNEYSPEVTKQTVRGILSQALLVLAAIIATPFIIRTIFYYVLAPLAERRASIRIKVPGTGNVPIPPGANSTVSLLVTLGQSEELLVRQDYLQSTALEAKKDTRWLLDYRHVFSSVASGLIFLTRIRGEGEITTVSAVRDPFAELTEVVMPQGAASVLHPRALVAVAQPEGRPVRITSHWRLFSLNAWLTLQLRYLVFHGPCRLVIKGGRGIRVEQAERGRIFGQDQLVGFSADLAYSVTRTETFAPYFFGREQLFKDKVEQGSGILIIEEAPLSTRPKGGIRSGLEGAFDASLKAFGI
jgi:urease beta subunit